MSKMIWVPDAVHRYYLQEVKRRSSVMKKRPVDPNLPDNELIVIYKDLLEKDSDELLEIIDPQFKQLSRIEQLNETIMADDQSGNSTNDSEPVDDSEPADDSEPLDKSEAADGSEEDNGSETANETEEAEESESAEDSEEAANDTEAADDGETTDDSDEDVEIVSMDGGMFESVPYPNEIVDEVTINATVEDNAGPSCPIIEMQLQEEIEMTFEILDEILVREIEEDEKMKEAKIRKEQEQESEEQDSEEEIVAIDNYRAQCIIEDNLPDYMIVEFDVSAQDLLNQLTQQELLNQETMEQEQIEQNIIQLVPMEEDLIQLEPMETEEPNNGMIIVEGTLNDVEIFDGSTDEVILTEEPMNEVIIIDKPISEVYIIENPTNEMIIMQEPVPNPASIPAPNPTPIPAPNSAPSSVPKRANRRKQKHTILQQAINSSEIEVIRDGVSKTILLDVRPAEWPKVRPMKTYERKRKQAGPMTDTRPNKQH